MTQFHGKLPERVYYLTVTSEGAPLPYGKRGGGHFTRLDAAIDRKVSLERYGVVSKIYEAEPVWKEVVDGSS